MSLISPLYFDNTLSLGQVTNSDVQTTVQNFINEFEPEFLQKLMGYPLYKAFLTETAGTPTARMQAVLTGANFTNYITNKLANYPGITPTPVDDQVPLSPIANYVYYAYMNDQSTFTSGSGEVKVANQNAKAASGVYKAVTAWNKMVEFSKVFRSFMQASNNTTAPVYPEYTDPFYTEDNFNQFFYYGDRYGGLDKRMTEVYTYKNSLGI